MDASDRRKRAGREAADWWVRLHCGDPGRKDREQFVDWLRESALHVAEMLRVAKVHDALEQFAGWADISTDELDDDGDNVVPLPPTPSKPEPSASSRHSGRRQGLWAGLIAAGLATLVAAAVVLMRGQVIETERGERREVVLADGSVLEVDPETRLRVSFEEHERQVLLERGRALFRVAPNPERPFFVRVKRAKVRAVGTAFGVEREARAIIVTVAEGKVGVTYSDIKPRHDAKGRGTSGPTAIPRWKSTPPAPTEILLTANQQVRLESWGSAQPVRTVDSRRELAWARGRLVFDDETVADAAAKFSRYNQIELKVADEKLAARLVTGVFDASDPESFISFLQTVTSVKVTRTDTETILE